MKIENKKTAVEWLLNEWQTLETTLPNSLIEKVLEMEKQQIIDAWEKGYHNFSKLLPEDYYNETFNNED
jgi:hemoglobin-like flavoprotein